MPTATGTAVGEGVPVEVGAGTEVGAGVPVGEGTGATVEEGVPARVGAGSEMGEGVSRVGADTEVGEGVPVVVGVGAGTESGEGVAVGVETLTGASVLSGAGGGVLDGTGQGSQVEHSPQPRHICPSPKSAQRQASSGMERSGDGRGGELISQAKLEYCMHIARNVCVFVCSLVSCLSSSPFLLPISPSRNSGPG